MNRSLVIWITLCQTLPLLNFSWADPARYDLTLGGDPLVLVKVQPGDLMVSERCDRKKSKPCQALRAAAQATSRDAITEGGANPGARICLASKGNARTATQANQSQVCVCTFADQSSISCGSLYSQALENDLKR